MYVFVGDLLGFQNIILNLDSDKRRDRVSDWISLIKETTEKFSLTRYQLVSDTVFVGAQLNEEGLKQLILFSQEFIQSGFKKRFPIRAAISYGHVTWTDEIAFGEPIVKAYRHAIEQNWVGCSFERHPNMDKNWSWDQLVSYPTPVKDGMIPIRAVIAWDIPNSNEIFQYFGQGGLTKPGEYIKWDLALKIQNTLLFGMYLRFMKKQKAEPENFHGFLPVQFLDALV